MRCFNKDPTFYQIQKGNHSRIISLKNPLDYDMGPNQLDSSPHPKPKIKNNNNLNKLNFGCIHNN